MWVKFTAPFTWPLERRVEIDYKPGQIVCVRQACGEAAKAEGKAEDFPTPSRAQAKAIAHAGNRMPRHWPADGPPLADEEPEGEPQAETPPADPAEAEVEDETPPAPPSAPAAASKKSGRKG